MDQSIFFLILFKKKSRIFSEDLNNQILDIFIKLEKPFSRYIMTTNRKNFFNYAFLLNQILIYLDEESIEEILPNIKNHVHLNEEILLFKKLIKEIDN